MPLDDVKLFKLTEKGNCELPNVTIGLYKHSTYPIHLRAKEKKQGVCSRFFLISPQLLSHSI